MERARLRALYPLMGAVEITLRNAIDQTLSASMGTFWWAGNRLRHRSYATSAITPYEVQAAHDSFIKATRKHISEMRSRHRLRGHLKPSHAGVIGKTEFSTWVFLLDAEFMGRGLIWPRHLSTVLRGAWPVRRRLPFSDKPATWPRRCATSATGCSTTSRPGSGMAS